MKTSPRSSYSSQRPSESSDDSDDQGYSTDITSLSDDESFEEAGSAHNGGQRRPGYYLANEEAINNSDTINVDYAPSTEKHLSKIEVQWRQYCSETGKRDPISALHSITIGAIDSFLRWKLDQKTNSSGRRLRGTKEPSSLHTYWKQFLLVYKRLTGKFLDGQIIRQMHELLRRIIKEYSLHSRAPNKAPMDVCDVTEHVQTILTTTKKMFKIGRSRIQNICFDQGGFITANRTKALLDLQYKHIVVSILVDPTGGPNRVLLEFTYEFTKSFLGPKAPNTYPIPEILFDPSLILSPQIFYLALLFHDQVFDCSVTPENIFNLKPRSGCKQLVLPMKPEKADQYVLRRCEWTTDGYRTTGEQLSDHTVRYDLKKCGEIAGFKHRMIPKNLRYGSGTAFNKDGRVSDALQNMIMMHSDMRTFVNHYLNRRVGVDAQAIVRGIDSQDEIMKAACRMSRWIDPDRPWKLTAEESMSVNTLPRIQRLVRRRDKTQKRDQVKYEELQKEIRNEKQRARAELLEDKRKNWDHDAAVRDIEAQLNGMTVTEKINESLQRCPDRTPQHARLIAAIFSLPASTLEMETVRRVTAIRAVVDYCDVQEGDTPRHPSLRAVTSDLAIRDEDASSLPMPNEEDSRDAALMSIFRKEGPYYCPDCPNSTPFSTAGSRSRHYRIKHIEKARPGEKLGCKECGIVFEKSEHKQAHAYRVHHVVT